MYKAKKTPKITQFHFMHFFEVRHRIDNLPHKKLYRLDVFRDLSTRALMSRFESQMAYGIIKRAFCAFYYGTGAGGIPNSQILSKKVHNPQCIWVHAAHRLAQLYNSYTGVLPIYEKYIELTLKRIFQKLHNNLAMMARHKHKNNECACSKCLQRILMGKMPIHKINQNSAYSPHKSTGQDSKKKLKLTATELFEKRDKQFHRATCNCQTFKWSRHDYKIYKQAIETNTGYGQGPFRCSWFLSHKDEIEAEQKPLNVSLPEEFICSDNDSLLDYKIDNIEESSCDFDCDCDCEYCECENEFESDDIDEMEDESIFENMQEFEQLSDNSFPAPYTKCGLFMSTNRSISTCQQELEKRKTIRRKQGKRQTRNLKKCKGKGANKISNYCTETSPNLVVKTSELFQDF